MSKLCKVFISVILMLVVFAGVYVGVMTKGFKKWDKLSFKEEKEKVNNTIFPEKLRTEKAYVGYCVVATGEGFCLLRNILYSVFNECTNVYLRRDNFNVWFRKLCALVRIFS